MFRSRMVNLRSVLTGGRVKVKFPKSLMRREVNSLRCSMINALINRRADSRSITLTRSTNVRTIKDTGNINSRVFTMRVSCVILSFRRLRIGYAFNLLRAIGSTRKLMRRGNILAPVSLMTPVMAVNGAVTLDFIRELGNTSVSRKLIKHVSRT